MPAKLSNSQYYEHLQENLGVLLDNGKIGFSKFLPTNVQTKPNKFLEMAKGFKNYHFCVDIPYAGRVLYWEIIFDPEDFSELPDFDFNDYSFIPEPDINYIAENVPSWDSWDLTNSQSLLNILNEFLSLYKKSQVEKLMKQNKYLTFKAQYEELLKTTELPADKVEVQIEAKIDPEYDTVGEDVVIVDFLIILPIDFAQLPEYSQESGEELLNPGDDFAYLNVQMRKPDSSRTKVALTLSPRAEEFLSKIKLPKFRKDESLTEYVLLVQTTIEKQIGSICALYHARNLFVSSLVDTFSRSIVEYDASKFYKISFIYEDFEDYDCLVTVQLGGKFPQDRPKVQLHSLYCQVGRNCNTNVVYHLYDPQASDEDNIRALREIIHDEVKLFHNHKH